MLRTACIFLLALGFAGAAPADDDKVVFRSDVALMRVDAQVVDRDNRAITGLRADDFVLREEGRVQQIRNFASEDMPLDVLFLLDVSASMRPHVQRIADAAHQALTVLGDDDRVGIMVFDRYTRLRMPFRKGRSSVERELDTLLRQEGFRGGTDITRGMYDAAAYVRREGRREARRAIVILTDDETQMERDDEGVLSALERADAVMSALIAPDAMGTRGGYGSPRGGGGWPGGGPSIGTGPIIWGRRGGYGSRGPGGYGGPRTHSAGTSEIARGSGGDSMPVTGASALEDTLERLRQRYALHFYLPGDVKGGQQRHLDISLTAAALRRYPDAQVRFRRTYYVPDGVTPGPAAVAGTGTPNDSGNADPVVVRAGAPDPATPMASGSTGAARRRRAVNEDGSAVDAPTPATKTEEITRAPDSTTAQPPRGWRRVDEPVGAPGPILDKKPDDKTPPKDDKTPTDTTSQDTQKTGWPKAK